MLCYVMLRYVMLCYVMLCYVMLCYVMLCYVMLCYVMLRIEGFLLVLFFAGKILFDYWRTNKYLCAPKYAFSVFLITCFKNANKLGKGALSTLIGDW